MSAPAFAGLDWTPSADGGWTTEGSSAFWDYYNVDRGGFKALGFGVSKPAATWVVVGPDIDDGNREAFVELLSAIHEKRSAGAERHRAALAAQESRDAIRAAQRAQEARQARELADAQVLEARSLKHSKIVADAREAGQACLDKWGTLVHQKVKLTNLVSMPLLTHGQIRLVYALVSETERKAADKARDARAVRDEDCVSWTDEAVERAVGFLTDRDADHAQLANGLGWSPAHTGAGHWCVAMLGTDRAAALRLARTLVGPYRFQLSTVLTHEEMP